MVSPFLQKCNYATLAPRVGFGFKLQQTALHCQQPCGGLFNLLYPVITMGFFSPGRILWPTVHEKSLAPTVHQSLNFRIPDSPKSSLSFLMIKNKRGAGESKEWYQPLCSLWSRVSLYTSLKLLLQSDIRIIWVFDLELLSLFPRLDCYFTLSCKEIINNYVFLFTCNPKQAAWLNLPSLGNRSR